jgi:Uma2 family endonuclease
MFDRQRPRDRLIYIEHRLYETALQQGYHESQNFDLGGSEKALLLEKD